MALIKAKDGNNIYTWKSDNIRDAEISAITNVYGAKNLLPFDLNMLKALNGAGTWNGNDYTRDGVTFSVDDTNKRIILNGTATSNSFCDLVRDLDFGTSFFTYQEPYYTNGKYIISDGLQEHDRYGCGYDADNKVAFIVVAQNVTVNNIILYPMIRDARITDPTYVPYAMTNKQLTDEIQNIPKVKKGQAYSEAVPVDTPYQGFYFGYSGYITDHGFSGTLIGYRVQSDHATAPYSILVCENRLKLLSSVPQTVNLTWAPVYI